MSAAHLASIPMTAHASGPLRGRIRIPGDKSISHRALLCGLLAIGETRISGLLESEDILHTVEAVRALGGIVRRLEEGEWRVTGVGIGGLQQPQQPLNFGNAGTGSRLTMGVVASHPITSIFDGDVSLRKRPMRRITDPLVRMGAEVLSETEGGRLPLTIRGVREAAPIIFETPVASAQVKSAVLFAGLNAPGKTTVIENEASRDHTERMLRHFGAEVATVPHGQFGKRITLTGQPILRASSVIVPSDPSSAAFPLVAALLIPGSDIVLENIMINPLRTGYLATLREMGANIEEMNVRRKGNETIADIRVRASALKGVDVPKERVPSMIDEYPILAVAAAFASGETRMRGLHELRVKESDRLQVIADGLIAAGIKVCIKDNDLIIEGQSNQVRGGGIVATHLDHRIAMSFLVLGLASKEGMAVDDGSMIATSFPNFVSLMQELGANMTESFQKAGDKA